MQVEALVNDSPLSNHEMDATSGQHQQTQHAIDLRSPRQQMFSNLPTPAYNQTQFQSLGATASHANTNDTGMIPMQPTYNYQMAPQGDGGYGSLNDALRSPTVYDMTGTGSVTPRDATKQRRRESGMMMPASSSMGYLGGGGAGGGIAKKPSFSRVREGEVEEGRSF